MSLDTKVDIVTDPNGAHGACFITARSSWAYAASCFGPSGSRSSSAIRLLIAGSEKRE
jgi:hypothetical protein